MAGAMRFPRFFGRFFAAFRSAIVVAGIGWVLLAAPAMVVRGQVGPDTRAEPSPGKPIIEGRNVFESKGCAHCHSIWGTGRHVGPDLGRRGADWRDVMWFAGELWNHAPAMNEKMRELKIKRATLSPGEVQKLAAYLFYVKFIGQPGDVKRGEALFDRAACSRCHQFAGRGGRRAPRLDDLKEHMSLYFLAGALWNHGPQMAKKMDKLKIARPYLEGDDLRDIVAFLSGGRRSFGALEIAYTQAGTPHSGEVLFRRKGCIRCHSVGGKGGTTAPDLGRQRLDLGLSGIAAALWDHGPTMWEAMRKMNLPVPKLNNREVSDLIAYLAFIQYLGPAGDSARGEELFREKSCSKCHALGGKGPQVGPDLVLSDASKSVLNWTAAIWSHASLMAEKLNAANVSWPPFADDEMRDLVAFLRSRRVVK